MELQIAFERLSPRQITCLALISQHLSAKEIASLLGISVHTVRGYLVEAMHTLGVSSQREAARLFLAKNAADPLFDSGINNRVVYHYESKDDS